MVTILVAAVSQHSIHRNSAGFWLLCWFIVAWGWGIGSGGDVLWRESVLQLGEVSFQFSACQQVCDMSKWSRAGQRAQQGNLHVVQELSSSWNLPTLEDENVKDGKNLRFGEKMSRDDGRELDLQTKGRSICQWTIATDQVSIRHKTMFGCHLWISLPP